MLTILGGVQTIFDTLRKTRVAGESVKVSGFGTFSIRRKAARIGRNPKTRKKLR